MNNQNELQMVSIRLVKDSPLLSEKPITNAIDAVKLIGKTLCEMDREVVCVLNLKTNGQPINCNIASIGALDYSIVSPREILKSSILSNASRIIMVHNHPSSKIIPSLADNEVTQKMIDACDLIGIPLLDHIIVGGNNKEYFSYAEKQILPFPHSSKSNIATYQDIEFKSTTPKIHCQAKSR